MLFLAFFLGMVYIFTLQKIVAQWDRIHPFFTFIVILVKFSAPKSSNFLCGNMGHKELKKSSKYKLVIFLDEKQRFTFASFLHIFIKGAPLTPSAIDRKSNANTRMSMTSKQKGTALVN